MSYNSYTINEDWEVIIHMEVQKWILNLEERKSASVMYALKALSLNGPSLGRPFVDHIKNSHIKNLKELRPLGGNLRLLFVFDSDRKAIVLVAGDKTNSWNKWYSKHIKIAEKRYEKYLDEKRKKHG